MKIVFLVSSMDAGGAERVAATLCNAWSKRGDVVTLVPTFSRGGTVFYELDEKVEIIFLADLVPVKVRSIQKYITRTMTLRRLIQEKKPDVVISFLANVNIMAILATAFSGYKCIVCERSDPSFQPIGWTLRLACKVLYRFADVICVQTQAVSISIHQVYSGLKKVTVKSNPLPTELLDLKVNKKSIGRKSILSIGRLSPEKRVEVIIEAFARLADRYADWDLRIYGQGPLSRNLRQQIESLRLQDRIFLHGPTKEPWQVMSESDIFVMTSLYEGFPNALLEAMSIGLPCISTDCPSGPREISLDGNDALLIGLNDKPGLYEALDKLMSDLRFRRELGERARASIIRRYTLEKILSNWDELFRSVGVKS